MEPAQGISKSDVDTLINEVNVVFHASRYIAKFNEVLKVSVKVKVQGTHRLGALCQNMKNLPVNK
jgi:hypothetical protein